jgi:hypothetical protein
MQVAKYVLHCSLGNIEFLTSELRTQYIIDNNIIEYTLSQFNDNVLPSIEMFKIENSLIVDVIDKGICVIDWEKGDFHKIYLNTYINLYMLQPSKCGELFLILDQDENGGHIINWPTGIKYPNGIIPEISTEEESVCIIKLFFDGDFYYLRTVENNYK